MGGVGVDWEDLICLGLISSGWGVILYICVRCRGQGAGGRPGVMLQCVQSSRVNTVCLL